MKRDSAAGYRLSAVASLACGIAAITTLAGVYSWRLAPRPVLHAGVALETVTGPTWQANWLEGAQSAAQLQQHALNEWLRVVLVLAGVALAIGCVNALLGLLAHSSVRRYELALASVLGARISYLRRQLRTQAFTNAVLAGAIGIPSGFVAALVVRASWPHETVPLARTSVVAWTLAALFGAGALALLAARISARRMKRAGWLGDAMAPEARSNPGPGAEDLRNLLVQIEFIIAFALIAAALLIWRHSATFLTHNDEQLNTQQLYIAPAVTPAPAIAFARNPVFAETIASPGAILGVGALDQVLVNCGRCARAMMYMPIFPLRTQQHVIGTDFFTTLGVQLTSGREFDVSSEKGARHIVVNDTFALLAFQGQDAIGKRVQVGGLEGEWYTVIGVAPDLPINTLQSAEPEARTYAESTQLDRVPAIYFFVGERPLTRADVIVRADAASVPAGMQPLRVYFQQATSPVRWFAGVLTILAALIALVAAFGLSTSLLLNVRQRFAEIAARRAIGARRRDVIRLVVQETGVAVARGCVLGAIVSLVLARALQFLVPRLPLIDVRVALGSALGLGVLAVAATVLPARAAASVPPAQVHA